MIALMWIASVCNFELIEGSCNQVKWSAPSQKYRQIVRPRATRDKNKQPRLILSRNVGQQGPRHILDDSTPRNVVALIQDTQRTDLAKILSHLEVT